MATATDLKRQSTGNKVATPRITSLQGPTEIDSGVLGKAVGARVKLVTSSPTTTIEGTIYTADHITNIVAIASSSSSSNSSSNPNSTNNNNDNTTTIPQPKDYHIIPIPRIQSFTILSLSATPSPDFAAATPPIGRMDTRALKAREDAAVNALQEAEARRGKGVGKEAQAIFDALSRTLPTRWSTTSIIINDNIILQPPYTSASCVAPQGTPASSLDRVKRVVENERRKLAAKGGAPGGEGDSVGKENENAENTSRANGNGNGSGDASGNGNTSVAQRKGG